MFRNNTGRESPNIRIEKVELLVIDSVLMEDTQFAGEGGFLLLNIVSVL